MQRVSVKGVLLRLTVAVAALLSMGAAGAAPKADLWDFWNVSDESSTQSVDHGRWQAFLDDYLRISSDGINRLAYRSVSASDRAKLGEYLDSLSSLDPRDYNRAEQLAYWINLYNALTVEVVLRHPKKGSILRMGKGLFSIGPWDDPLLTIAGEPLTLNDIEHRVLRPIWQDRRIHYAVNCASIGCPNLATTAYTASNVETLLDAGEAAYINHPRGVRFDDRGRLQLSELYKWYAGDFAADEPALVRYLAEHHTTMGSELVAYTGRIRYDYDWALNGS